MADQPFTVAIQVADDHVDPHAFPDEVNVRSASNGRTELVMRVVAEDPVDALARAEFLIDVQPLTIATLRVGPRRELEPDDEGPIPVLVTVPEAADRLHISQQRIRQLIEGGAMHATKPGRDWLLREADVTRRQERMAARQRALEPSLALREADLARAVEPSVA